MLELIDFTKFPGFLLVFMRVTAFFVTVPIFSYRNVPTSFKVGFSLFLSWIMFYTIPMPEIAFDMTFILLVVKEALVGLLIGLVAYMIMAAIQIAGGLIDFQMGFAIANVMDPQTGAQSPLTGQYFYTIAMLFLLAVNGHHLLIDGIFYSYQTVPIDAMIAFGEQGIAEFAMRTLSKLFIIAFQMAMPIVGCLFLVDVALGIVARTVPQLNVFVVGLPLKIFVSFFLLVVSMGIYFTLVRSLFEYATESMRGLMLLFGGA